MSTSQLIEFTIDGRKVSVPAGTTIFDAARANNIPIPTLCNQQNETPVGRLPRLRSGCRSQGVRGVMHSARGTGNGGEYRFRRRETGAAYSR